MTFTPNQQKEIKAMVDHSSQKAYEKGIQDAKRFPSTISRDAELCQTFTLRSGDEIFVPTSAIKEVTPISTPKHLMMTLRSNSTPFECWLK